MTADEFLATRQPGYFATPTGEIESRHTGKRVSLSDAWTLVAAAMANARSFKVRGADDLRAICIAQAHDLIDAIAEAEGVGTTQEKEAA